MSETAKKDRSARGKKSGDNEGGESPSFESALERLEAIVGQLENGDVPLADLISRYEEASALLKNCQQQLDAAQLRIEKLGRKESAVTFEPFSPEA